MAITLDYFGLGIETPLAIPTSRSYRPPSWPPPRDWVCIEDKDGNAVSRWGDPIWHLWPWSGKNQIFNFGDGQKIKSSSPVIDPANADLLRLLVTWRVWGPRAAVRTNTLFAFAIQMRTIVAVCSENNILASDLSRFPALIEKLANRISPASYNTAIADLERILDAREVLGFKLLDRAGIKLLKAAQPDHAREQTAYIPPRIWTYVVKRQKECIDEYLTYQKQIEYCFEFCLDAYEKNGVLEARSRARTRGGSRGPFQHIPKHKKNSHLLYLGPFSNTAQRFGIKGVLERWIGNLDEKKGIAVFSTYFGLIQYVALADILAFTLMRRDEGLSIRKNCLVWHDDEVYGRIPMVQAETTKTDPDSAALWVTSPSVEMAIRALTSIAKMRLGCLGKWDEDSNPHLINHAWEPWGRPNRTKIVARPSVESFSGVISRFPCLFDPNQLAITEYDLKIAKAVCPTLNAYRFQVGKPWPLALHQFRRTGAVNMFASGDISDSSIQIQMKHLTRLMPLYYGRGNSTLHLNESARVLLVNAQYEAMGRQLAAVHTDRFVSPYGDAHKAKMLASANGGEPVNLISESDAKHYETAARKHQITFRLTVLGGCMKNGQCEGDCVTSISDCAGGDGKSPCANVLFDRNRAEANQIRLDGVTKQLETTPPDTPRYRHLEQERRGLENYFAYVNRS